MESADDVLRVSREAFLAKYPFTPVIGLPKRAPEQRPTHLAGADLRVLVDIFNRPFVAIATRAAHLGFRNEKALRYILDRLDGNGWLEKQSFSRRQGHVHYHNISPRGLSAAGLEMPPFGMGSFLHRRCQEAVRNHLVAEGFSAVIECRLRDKSADVGYCVEGRWVAYECGLSRVDSEHENVVRDFAAGFHEVHCLLQTSNMRDALERMVKERGGVVPKGLSFELVSDYLETPPVKEEMPHA